LEKLAYNIAGAVVRAQAGGNRQAAAGSGGGSTSLFFSDKTNVASRAEQRSAQSFRFFKQLQRTASICS